MNACSEKVEQYEKSTGKIVKDVQSADVVRKDIEALCSYIKDQ
jgi:hypothetical protein